MRIENGKRAEWEFEYTALKLVSGAKAQLEFRIGRRKWWEEAKEKLISEIKESGLEISESVAAGTSYSNTANLVRPQVLIRADLQTKLSECSTKISAHQQAINEYSGWIQVLEANPEQRLKLTQSDWLYFFGRL